MILSKVPPPSVGDEPSQATVTGSPLHSQTNKSLNHKWLRHSSDGCDGRDDVPTTTATVTSIDQDREVFEL